MNLEEAEVRLALKALRTPGWEPTVWIATKLCEDWLEMNTRLQLIEDIAMQDRSEEMHEEMSDGPSDP